MENQHSKRMHNRIHTQAQTHTPLIQPSWINNFVSSNRKVHQQQPNSFIHEKWQSPHSVCANNSLDPQKYTHRHTLNLNFVGNVFGCSTHKMLANAFMVDNFIQLMGKSGFRMMLSNPPSTHYWNGFVWFFTFSINIDNIFASKCVVSFMCRINQRDYAFINLFVSSLTNVDTWSNRCSTGRTLPFIHSLSFSAIKLRLL